MRRCLLIAAFLLLAAPAGALAQERATVKLSSKPDKVPAGERVARHADDQAARPSAAL